MKTLKLLNRVLNYRSTKFWGGQNSRNFVIYLRNNNIKVGNNVNFRYPKTVEIDVNCPSLVEFGDNLDINANFTVLTHDFATYVFRNLYHDFISSTGRVKIGSNIYFGRDVTILKGVTIGDNCIIGLGSVITKDIPSNSVAAGCPCKVICSIDEYYEKRREAQVSEAIDLGVSIIERYHRDPKITDFKEEWVMFLTEDDMKRYPEIMPAVNFRISKVKDDFFKQRKMFFNGWEEFLSEVKKTYKQLHP